MSPAVKKFLQRWLIDTLAVLVAVWILGPARIHYQAWPDLLIASLLLGVLNAVLKPFLLRLTLPLLILTLGLFFFIINAALLWLVGQLVPNFHVAGFWPAFWGAIIISLVSLVLNTITGTGAARLSVQRGPTSTTKKSGRPNDDDGPIIDV